VTKTGSESLLQAFHDSPDVICHGKQVKGHGVTLGDVPDDRIAIISLRDPVDRFRSGYDMNYRENHADIVRRYPTASDMAMEIADIMFDEEWGYTYRPQILWTGGAEEMKRRGVHWMMTEDIDDFIRDIDIRDKNVHDIHWNTQDWFRYPRSSLTPKAVSAILEAYRADFRMLRQLGVEYRYFKWLDSTMRPKYEDE